jgi:hypothetical protein
MENCVGQTLRLLTHRHLGGILSMFVSSNLYIIEEG